MDITPFLLDELTTADSFIAHDPFFPTIGNGSLFLRLAGSNISGVRAGIPSPSLISLTFSFPGDAADTRRFWQGSTLCHELTLSPNTDRSDYSLCDFLHPNKPLFCRRITSSHPFCAFWQIPAYVETFWDPQYAFHGASLPCLRLQVRRGFPLGDDFFSEKESTLLLFVTGKARLFPEQIQFDVGESSLYLVGNSIEEALPLAEQILSEQWAPAPPVGEKRSVIQSEGRRRMLSEILTSHIAPGGGAARSFDRPYAYAADAPAWVEALCRLGELTYARQLLLFYLERFRHHGRFYFFYSLDSFAVRPCENNDLGGLFLLAAALNYFDHDPDPLFFSRLSSMMTTALREADHHWADDTLPFSGAEPFFEDDPQRYRHLFDGSLLSTLTYIDSAERFLALAVRLEKPMPHADHIRQRIDAAKAAVSNRFCHSGVFSLNASNRAHAIRRPRFSRSVCLGCLEEAPFPYEGILEKDGSGLYLCPRCKTKHPRPTLPERPPFFGEKEALILLALSPFGRTLLARHTDSFQKALLQESLAQEDTSPLSRGFGLAAALAASDIAKEAETTLVNRLNRLTGHSAILPVFYHHEQALVETPDPAAAALLLAYDLL